MSFVINLFTLGFMVIIDLILKIIASPLWWVILAPAIVWFLYMIERYGGTKEINGKWVKCDPNERK